MIALPHGVAIAEISKYRRPLAVALDCFTDDTHRKNHCNPSRRGKCFAVSLRPQSQMKAAGAGIVPDLPAPQKPHIK